MIFGENFGFNHIPRCAGTSIVNALYDDGLIATNAIQEHTPMTPMENQDYYDEEDFIFTFVRNPFDRIVSMYHWTVYDKFKPEKYAMFTGNVGLHIEMTFEEWFDCRYSSKVLEIHDDRVSYPIAFFRIVPKKHLFQILQRSVDHLMTFGMESQIAFLNERTDFVGRFENIKQDWKKVCKEINCKTELPHSNQTERQDYKKYYTPERRDLILKLYEDEFKKLDYDW